MRVQDLPVGGNENGERQADVGGAEAISRLHRIGAADQDRVGHAGLFEVGSDILRPVDGDTDDLQAAGVGS